MALNRSINRFNEGKWSEQLYGRWDLDGYEHALSEDDNFIPRKYGPAKRRQGTERAGEGSSSGATFTKLLPFSNQLNDNYVLQFKQLLNAYAVTNCWAFVWETNSHDKVTLAVGDTTAWATTTAYTRGDYVNESGTVYRCDNDHTSGTFATDLTNGEWVADDQLAIFTAFGSTGIWSNANSIHVAQINDVMYFCHRSFPPQKLSRFSDKVWTWEEVSWGFPPCLSPNTDSSRVLTLSDTVGTGLTLTATVDTFTNDMLNGYFALTRTRPANEQGLTLAATGVTASFTMGGDWTFVTNGVWGGTIEVRRSIDGFASYEVVTKVSSTIGGATNDANYTVTGNESDPSAEYRIDFVQTAAGTAPTFARMFCAEHKIESHVQITAYTNEQSVTVDVINDFEPAATGAWTTNEWREGAFSDERGYPSDCTFFQGRLAFAGTSYRKLGLWLSKTDSFEDHGRDVNATLSTDALFYLLSSQDNNRIQWIRGKKYLLVGTEGEVYSVRGADGFPLSPSVEPLVTVEASVGSEYVMPEIVEDRVVFVRRGGTEVHSINFDSRVDGFGSEHLNKLFEIDLPDGQTNRFTGDRLQQLVSISNPDNIVYALGDRDIWNQAFGAVLSEEDGVNAWFEYKSRGPAGTDRIISAAATTGRYGDEVWFAVDRDNELSIEWTSPRNDRDSDNDNYLDSAYIDGTPPASGILPNNTLDHFEGLDVYTCVDGKTLGPFTVATGSIDYGVLNASNLIVGLRETCTLTTLPLQAPSGDGASRGKPISSDKVTIGFNRTRGPVDLTAHYSYDNGHEEEVTIPISFRETWHASDVAEPIFTGQKEVEVPRRRDCRWVRLSLTSAGSNPITVTHIVPRVSPHGR